MDCLFIAYSWVCNFLNASVFFSVRKITISYSVFVEDVYLWGRVNHEYHNY